MHPHEVGRDMIAARRLIVATALLISLFGVPSLASAKSECIASLSRADPAGDVVNRAGVSTDTSRLDILGVEMHVEGGELVHTTRLAARPGDQSDAYYRYWLIFWTRSGAEEPEPMDVRISSTTTYDSGHAVGPSKSGNSNLGEYPISWEGTTMTVRIPIADLEDGLGQGLEFGLPGAQSDGIHQFTIEQGPLLAAPYVQDFAQANGTEPFVPLERCGTPQAPIPAAREVPGSSAVVAMSIVAAAAVHAARRRSAR